jgi:hypothetical protein
LCVGGSVFFSSYWGDRGPFFAFFSFFTRGLQKKKLLKNYTSAREKVLPKKRQTYFTKKGKLTSQKRRAPRSFEAKKRTKKRQKKRKEKKKRKKEKKKPKKWTVSAPRLLA